MTHRLHLQESTTAPTEEPKAFNISKAILTLVYCSLTEPFRIFNFSSWYNLLNTKHKTRPSCITNQTGKICGSLHIPLSELQLLCYYKHHPDHWYKVPRGTPTENLSDHLL